MWRLCPNDIIHCTYMSVFKNEALELTCEAPFKTILHGHVQDHILLGDMLHSTVPNKISDLLCWVKKKANNMTFSVTCGSKLACSALWQISASKDIQMLTRCFLKCIFAACERSFCEIFVGHLWEICNSSNIPTALGFVPLWRSSEKLFMSLLCDNVFNLY